VTDAAEATSGTVSNDPCSYDSLLISQPILSGADCDGDGILDVTEIADGSNPFDPCDPISAGAGCIEGIFVPTGFSPNGQGDGENETLTLIVGNI
jgi:hypothetical protein